VVPSLNASGLGSEEDDFVTGDEEGIFVCASATWVPDPLAVGAAEGCEEAAAGGDRASRTLFQFVNPLQKFLLSLCQRRRAAVIWSDGIGILPVQDCRKGKQRGQQVHTQGFSRVWGHINRRIVDVFCRFPSVSEIDDRVQDSLRER
jgi:hypothetical protein